MNIKCRSQGGNGFYVYLARLNDFLRWFGLNVSIYIAFIHLKKIKSEESHDQTQSDNNHDVLENKEGKHVFNEVLCYFIF